MRRRQLCAGGSNVIDTVSWSDLDAGRVEPGKIWPGGHRACPQCTTTAVDMQMIFPPKLGAPTVDSGNPYTSHSGVTPRAQKRGRFIVRFGLIQRSKQPQSQPSKGPVPMDLPRSLEA